MSEVVDITGLLAKVKSGWEQRAEQLCKPEHFGFAAFVKPELSAQLSESEKIRLKKKLDLVIKAATWMAAGMLKGTLKYANDDYSINQWMAHLVGEGSDHMNYQVLLWHAWQEEAAQRAGESQPPPDAA